MNYKVSYKNPAQHYLDIEIEVKNQKRDKMYFQIPAWRPGRYELGNFAKNIQKWQAFDEGDNPLIFKKVTKDRWEVNCQGAEKVVIKYNYFANELNAGSSFLSEDQVYINPVNCLIYEESSLHENCFLQLDLPKTYRCATSLKKRKDFNFEATDFDELADSPIIASETLQQLEYKVSGTVFHLWFQGEFNPDADQLINDFSRFTEEQIKLFGDFPTAEYHFLFQIVPFSFYHGVEHGASTVIVLGPTYAVLKPEGRYEDLLGVSSHELFHTWNVKRIRPVEMWPYDFTKENYTRLGYLTEGATTWYGDLMLYRSGVFDDTAFFKTFKQLLDRHFNNPGVLNSSVAESSFDTWLDGYVSGVPNRKASIYTEGALITFLLDVEIRRSTNNQSSFDQVIRSFYDDLFKAGKGVSELDYRQTVEKFANKSLANIFDRYIYGHQDISEDLNQALDYLGLEMSKKASTHFHEAHLGIKVVENTVQSVYPGSIADSAGISIQDKILSVNGFQLHDDLSDWLKYFKDKEIELGFLKPQGKYSRVRFKLDENHVYYAEYQVSHQKSRSKKQQAAFDAWKKTEV